MTRRRPESDPTVKPETVMGRLARLHALSTATAIADAEGVELGEMCGRARTPAVCRARRRVWTVLRHTLEMSYPEIARAFGVDHTTVMQAIRLRERELAEMYRPDGHPYRDGGDQWAAQ